MISYLAGFFPPFFPSAAALSVAGFLDFQKAHGSALGLDTAAGADTGAVDAPDDDAAFPFACATASFVDPMSPLSLVGEGVDLCTSARPGGTAFLGVVGSGVMMTSFGAAGAVVGALALVDALGVEMAGTAETARGLVTVASVEPLLDFFAVAAEVDAVVLVINGFGGSLLEETAFVGEAVVAERPSETRRVLPLAVLGLGIEFVSFAFLSSVPDGAAACVDSQFLSRSRTLM